MNSAIDIDAHPINVVRKLVAGRHRDLTFTYSIYMIAPPGRQASAPRTPPIRVAASEVDPNWLIEQLSSLGPHQEIAWHSRVESKGETFHLPMIDFIERPSTDAIFDLERIIKRDLNTKGRFIFFHSGRSFHAYLPGLIPERDWCTYLGNLLLLNQEGHLPVVDVRWLGHALIRGFAALRWSCNTPRYLAMPHRVNIDAQLLSPAV